MYISVLYAALWRTELASVMQPCDRTHIYNAKQVKVEKKQYKHNARCMRISL